MQHPQKIFGSRLAAQILGSASSKKRFRLGSTRQNRKTVASRLDDAGFSIRHIADQLGHAKVSMTQDVYMGRGKVHPQVAAVLDRAISDE